MEAVLASTVIHDNTERRMAGRSASYCTGAL
jgi:hypothetical protein